MQQQGRLKLPSLISLQPEHAAAAAAVAGDSPQCPPLPSVSGCVRPSGRPPIPKNLTAGSSSTNSTITPGLIIIRYGDNRKAIVNSFCLIIHMIKFIKVMSGCRAQDAVDLMSWRQGNLLNIYSYKAEYAHRHVKHRETYLLVRIIYDNCSPPIYESMLNHLEEYNPTLADKLAELSKPARALQLKNKWANLSKRGTDQPTSTERKSGLKALLAKEKGKLGIVGLIAAVKEQRAIQSEDKVSATGSFMGK